MHTLSGIPGIHIHDCLGCAVLLCFVCLFDLACFFLSSISSLIKTCITPIESLDADSLPDSAQLVSLLVCTVCTYLAQCMGSGATLAVDSCDIPSTVYGQWSYTSSR